MLKCSVEIQFWPWKPQISVDILQFVGNVQIQLENQINVLDLPDNSPYLNPIENYWIM